LDVNIHPTKKEVRILGARFLQDILINAIRKIFQEKGIFAQTEMQLPRESFTSNGLYTERNEKFSFAEIREAAAQWKAPEESPAQGKGTAADRSFSDQSTAPVFQKTMIEGMGSLPFGITRVLDQIHGTYIVAETSEGLALVDQHAAHERIIYEELMVAFAKKPSHAQKLLLPLTLHLDLQGQSVMEKCLPDFEKVGFGINALGQGTYSVDAVPVCLSDQNCVQTLQDTIHELLEEGFSPSQENRQKMLAAALACKSRTVKAGQNLDNAEIVQLIRKLAATQNPYTCPHGRPTLLQLTTHELEKRFKRS
jgi:DNA mismatch repair protein MutL